MARVFNGNMWSGIGNAINANRMYRDQQQKEAWDNLSNSALSVEKMVSNNNMRNAIMDFYKGKEDEAKAKAAAEEQAAADYVDDQLGREEALFELANLDDGDLLAGSIFDDDDNTIGMGKMFNKFQEKGIPFKTQDQIFAENFDPNAQNSVEDIKRMQRLMGMDEEDVKWGKWGPKSRKAYAQFKGA